MRKLAFLFVLIAGFLLASCNNDDIPVGNTTVIRINPSTVISSFSYQINSGDLDGVEDGQSLRIRLFVYDENGILCASGQQEIQNYLTSATFTLNLENDKEYTAVAISDITDSNSDNLAEYWSVSDALTLANLQITYKGSDINYGSQEILGITSANVVSGNNVTIDLQAAGAMVCSYVKNLHANSSVDNILIWGSRGNGYFDFDNGALNSNPDLEMLPYFMDIDVPNTSYSGVYAYKFLMPQTSYGIYLGLYDESGSIICSSTKTALTLSKGHEYLFLATLSSGSVSASFTDVTGQQTRSGITKEDIDLNNSKTYKVKDLL